MVKDARHRTTLGNWFRFLIRFLGLTGVLAAVAGAFVLFSAATALPQTLDGVWPFVQGTVQPALAGAQGEGAHAGALALVIGAAAIALWLVVEAFGALFLVTGRRTVAGTSSTLQIAIAGFLLVAVNVYSFSHYLRWDFTREQEFTLPASVAGELRKLNPDSPTTIVVLQKHQTFATLAGKQDSYDTAADAKVVEKVRDLVDQFRELGGRFKVVALDVNDKRFDQNLNQATEGLPKLREAVLAAPESSIFFAAGDRVQRLAFSDFLQLDKTGSREANNGRGNLVLREQGLDGFARRILAIQEKRPKVALAVIHEVLSTDAADKELDLYTSAGLRQALEEQGFDVVDILLKQWNTDGPAQPAVNVLVESKLGRYEADLRRAEEELNEANQLVADQAKIAKVKDQPFAARAKVYLEVFGDPLDQRSEPLVLRQFQMQVDEIKKFLPKLEEAKKKAEEQVRSISDDERAIEGKKQQDMKAKFEKLLSDVDLLILPRLTIMKVTTPPDATDAVPATLYKLSESQASVVKDFMKSGKPVLACVGPVSSRVRRNPTDRPGDFQKRLNTAVNDNRDDLDKLLAERGIDLGNDTIIFNSELDAFSVREAGQQFGGGKVTIPTLGFDPPSATGAKANPLSEAMRTTSRGVGQPLDLRLRALRRITLNPGWKERVPFAAEFLATSPDAWNETRPFTDIDPIDARTARLYIPKLDTVSANPKDGEPLEERRGPFAIGVAVESKPPAHWYDERLARERLAALAVLGNTEAVSELAKLRKDELEDRRGQKLAIQFAAFGAAGHPLATAALTTAILEKAEQPAEEKPDSRVVVIGHGGVFTGLELKPAQQKLLLHSLNWLLGRSDRMPRTDAPTWQYPRVNLSEQQFSLWRFGTSIGLPFLAIYFGLIVLMIRKVR